MASTVRRKRKGGKIKVYISHRFVDEYGAQRQKQIPCKNELDAAMILDDVQAAEKAGREYIRPIEPQSYAPPSAHTINEKSIYNLTISELLAKYVEIKCAEDWEAGTLSNSTSIINNYINPYIGNTPVAGIKPQFMQDYYNDLPNHMAVMGNHKNAKPKPISARTVHEIHKILRPAFNLAAVMGIIEYNPTLPVKKPKIPKYRRKQWSEETLEKALMLCEDKQIRLLILLMFDCTLRSGELSGLTWDCVNISKEAIAANDASITIDKSVRRLKKADIEKTRRRNIIKELPNQKTQASSTVVIKTPKTDESVRSLPLSRYVAKQVAKYKAAQEQRIAEAGDEYHDLGYSFVFTQLNGRPYDVKSLSNKFQRFRRDNGLPEIDTYSLRHTGATTALRDSDNIKVVQRKLGHATPEMTVKKYTIAEDNDIRDSSIRTQDRFYSRFEDDDDDDDDDDESTLDEQ